MNSQLDLDQARKLIVSHSPTLASEEISLLEACGRVCAQSLTAALPIPHFRQSAMDGFALRREDCVEGCHIPIISEIAAGSTQEHRVKNHTAIRIMTGGRVPESCDQVVPFEECRETKGVLSDLHCPSRSHIRKVGTDVKKGHHIVKSGEMITPGHMHLAATAGAQSIKVYARPKAAIICTGSELVDDSPLPGQVISGNRFLLAGLIAKSGGLVSDAATVKDDIPAILNSLKEMSSQADLVITTGGMGPGKYDLVAQALTQLGVTIHYRALKLRPGKATLFGTKNDTLFFALPGPPPAVRLLFHELVHPALLALQGRKKPGPKTLRAELTEELAIKQKGLLNLKGGILTLANGRCQVRPADRHEAASCIILVPAHRRCLKKGELVTIHLTEW
ncbi:MAG: molybdopterin molybdotransferase MoeA [Proteobacteria bacterium]|nr:molybdopterin molybdotransferase MoeA [Pseudomonadota bacterium]MBU1641435.1 molybdopterin molybdotransferase MoeA [Pseudomonadota bacterium]